MRTGIFVKSIERDDAQFFEAPGMQPRTLGIAAAFAETLLPVVARDVGKWPVQLYEYPGTNLGNAEIKKIAEWQLERAASDVSISNASISEGDWFTVFYQVHETNEIRFVWRVVSQAADPATWRVIQTVVRGHLRERIVSWKMDDFLFNAVYKLLFSDLNDLPFTRRYSKSPSLADIPTAAQSTSMHEGNAGADVFTDRDKGLPEIQDVRSDGLDREVLTRIDGSAVSKAHESPVSQIPPFQVLPVQDLQASQPPTSWWRFPLEVGRRLGALSFLDRSIQCAMLVPVIEYVAAYVSIGFLMGRAQVRLERRDAQLAEHFKRICSLPDSSEVLVCYGDTLIIGRARNQRQDLASGKYVRNIEYFIGGHSETDPYHLETAKNLFLIPRNVREAIQWDDDELLRSAAELSALAEDDLRCVAELITTRAETIMVVGEKNQFREEVCSSLKVRGADRDQIIGPLNAVLQLAGLSKTYLPATYSVPTIAQNPAGDAEDAELIVFRGAKSFLRNSQRFINRSWLAIIGANEPRAEDAAIQFRSMYSQRKDDIETIQWPSPPPGSEFSVYARSTL